MVKTFQEWFESLDEASKAYLASISNIIKGYDKNGVETKYEDEIVEYKLNINTIEHNKDDLYYDYTVAKKSWKDDLAVKLLYASRLKSVDLISDSEYHEILKEGVDRFNNVELQKYLTIKDFKYAMKLTAIYKWNDKILGCLLAADDLEKPDWSLLVSEKDRDNYFEYKWFNFIPFNEALKLVRKDVTVVRHLVSYIKYVDNSETKENYRKQLRELIFCENGLAKLDRNKAIITIYRDKSINEFIKDILTIDIHFGKLLPDLYKAKSYNIRGISEEMNYVINLRKREYSTKEEQLQNDNWYESKEANEYRYCKDIRQMAMIYRACLTKSYPKSKASLIGDALCLLKMYDFDWNQIFDAVYGYSDI